MRLIDADEVIRDLEAMKRFGYDAIDLDGLIEGLRRKPAMEKENPSAI